MKKGQSDRLTKQQKEGEGSVTIFHQDAQSHDKEVGDISKRVMKRLEMEYPMLKFRYRKNLSKQEINSRLQQIDKELGQTLYLEKAKIRPDGGLIEVLDDNNKWRVVLVSEAKHQGKDIENIRNDILVGKNHNQDLMAAGNAIERAYKNIDEIANFMLSEHYFPYLIFLEGSNFLTHDITITRPNGEKVTLKYNDGTLNRLDRLTASNYGMPINTNLCKNKFVQCNDTIIMLQAASIYTSTNGEHWKEEDMISVMLEVARTSLQALASDLFNQLSR